MSSDLSWRCYFQPSEHLFLEGYCFVTQTKKTLEFSHPEHRCIEAQKGVSIVGFDFVLLKAIVKQLAQGMGGYVKGVQH